jgi:hypothetical protein
METVTLKRGRGKIDLVKSDNLIAVRPTMQSNLKEVLSLAATESNQNDTGTMLGGFSIIKVDGTNDEMENSLDQIRSHYSVDAGSHVYHTPKNTAPIVPTGKITLRFNGATSNEERQQIIDDHNLEILDSSVKENDDGTKTETYTVRTTPDSPNPLKVAESLQQSPIVSLAEPDLATPGKLFAFQLPTDEFLKEQWHLKNDGIQFNTNLGLKAGADARVIAAWRQIQSFGSPACVIAVIDDGFDLTHPDLSGGSKIIAPWDFLSNSEVVKPRRFNPDSRQSDYHGTACSGVATGNINGGKIAGAAPNCRLMPIKWSGSLSDDSIKKWFGYAAAQGAWVISCSWGAAADNFSLSTVMDEAITECATKGRNDLGCVIVFAAGNSNHDINDPENGTMDGFATHPHVIAVAACNSLDRKSNYSNFGEEISVCAPSSGTGGRGILTSDVRGTFQFQGMNFDAGYDAGDYTKTFGGTSSATPLVAGICALMLSTNPSLTSAQVREIIENTARRIGPPESYVNGHSREFGHGCINAEAAVEGALSFGQPANNTEVNMMVEKTDKSEEKTDKSEAGKFMSLIPEEFWGVSRHEMIAHAAEQRLNERARAKVREILSPLGDNTTLQDVAGWADQIKGVSAEQAQEPATKEFLTQFPHDASRDWHFLDLPLDTVSLTQAEELGFRRDDDVVRMVNKTVEVLQGTSLIMSELNALRMVVHLVGDVHQPVHIGCGFVDSHTDPPQIVKNPVVIRQNHLPHDRGGNNLLLPFGASVNLHGYWDSQIPGNINMPPAVFGAPQTFSDDDAANDTAANDKSNTAVPLKSKEEAIRNFMAAVDEFETEQNKINASIPAPAGTLPPEQWADEWGMKSLESARQAYRTLTITERAGNKFKVSCETKAQYNARCTPIVSERMTSAALNLAKLLNAIL